MKPQTVLFYAMLLGFQLHAQQNEGFSSVQVDTLMTGDFNIRAIEPDRNSIAYAADNSRFGYVDLDTKQVTSFAAPTDSLEFRSIAIKKRNIFLLNVGSPAYLLRFDTKSRKSKVVYREAHKDAFYDSMKFWNDREGIAIGDPIDGCLSIIITRDGGNKWTKISCDALPSIISGEAAFAASNSNICIVRDKTWVVSGGQTSRVFYSPDKGKTWTVFNTPISDGKAMTGIFSADFYDSEIGIIAGGDYEMQLQNSGNKALTVDGGKTWKLIGENTGPGYISSVRFVPGGNGKEIVSVGATGLYYSADSGSTWTLLYTDNSLYTIRFVSQNVAVAAGRNKMIRLKFK